MSNQKLGKFISELRRSRGMTQKELGEKLFVSDKTVSRWECGETLPDLSLIPLIAEIFDITTDELLKGKKESSDVPFSEKSTNSSDSSDAKFNYDDYNIQQKQIAKALNKLLFKKLLIVSLCILVIICICLYALNGLRYYKLRFDNYDDFKFFMESDYNLWYSKNNDQTSSQTIIAINTNHPYKVYKTIILSNDAIVCNYYYNPDLYKEVTFSSNHDKLPIMVTAYSLYGEFEKTFQAIETVLYFSIPLQFVAIAVIYLVQSEKNKLHL